jgi:hypothetical protein
MNDKTLQRWQKNQITHKSTVIIILKQFGTAGKIGKTVKKYYLADVRKRRVRDPLNAF